MTIPNVPSASPLTEADFLAVRLAEKRHRVIKRAARIAAFSAVSTLVIAAISLIITFLFFGFWSVVVTIGLTVFGVVEFRAHTKLLRAEPAACRTLALNQIAFFALIAVYCFWQMITFSIKDLPADYRQPLTEIYGRGSIPMLVNGFYLLVIILSLAYCGGLALYYYTRRRHVEAFVRETPDWVRRHLLELDR
jgi:hypothetical protein